MLPDKEAARILRLRLAARRRYGQPKYGKWPSQMTPAERHEYRLARTRDWRRRQPRKPPRIGPRYINSTPRYGKWPSEMTVEEYRVYRRLVKAAHINRRRPENRG